MCGRYALFCENENKEIMRIIQQVQDKIKIGEIYPTNPAPVILADGVYAYNWGFPKFGGKGVIINARAETAEEKRMFKKCVAERRCVIPSTGFYEWENKRKYHFTLPGNSVLYMAGIYNDFAGESRFVILTTEANASIEEIHDRMPLVLPQNMINDWISNDAAAMHILHDTPPILERQLADQAQPQPLF